MSRRTAASLGKIPTTLERRLISLLSRSSGLFDHTLRQCALGKLVNAKTSVRALRIDSAALGNRSLRVSVTSSQRAVTSSLVPSAKTERNAAATISWDDLGSQARRLRA